eukprot:scaffold108816_cov47-Phaeocystis_antarctica.AAC.2
MDVACGVAYWYSLSTPYIYVNRRSRPDTPAAVRSRLPPPATYVADTLIVVRKSEMHAEMKLLAANAALQARPRGAFLSAGMCATSKKASSEA